MKNINKAALILTTCLSVSQVHAMHYIQKALPFIKSGAIKVAKESGECGKIVGGSILAACIYGIANDQVSARVCPEYFTEGFHRRMIERGSDGWLKQTLLTTKSPAMLGAIWGVIATWWMGAALSIPVTLAARFPLGLPKIGMKELVKPTGIALLGMGISSLAAGIYGYIQARNGNIDKDAFEYATLGTPQSALNRWFADAYAHQVAYASGAFAGLALTSYALYKRFTMKK